MRLDHLLSREYEKRLRQITGLSSVVGIAKACGRMYYIVLKVRKRTFKRAKGRRPGHRGGVAQLGEHLLCKQGVIGSNPFISTTSFTPEGVEGRKEKSRETEIYGRVSWQADRRA